MLSIGLGVGLTKTRPTGAGGGGGGAPLYYFEWDAQSNTANYINRTSIPTPPASLGAESDDAYMYSSAAIAANPNDSNNLWLHTPGGAGFPTANWFNNTSTPIWGADLTQVYVEFEWMYITTYSGAKLVFQLNQKCIQNVSVDANAGVGIRTKLIGGGSAHGLDVGPDGLIFADPTSGAKKRIIFRSYRRLTNPSGLRNGIVYVYESGETSVKSGYTVTAIAGYDGVDDVFHQVQFGDDTPTSTEQWHRNCKVYNTADYPFGFDLPVNFHCDFNFTGTIDATALNAVSHIYAGTSGWKTIIGVTGWNMTGSGFTLPSTINLYTPSSTRSIRRDLTVTTGGGPGFTFGAATTKKLVGFALRTANIAAGNTINVAYAGGATPAHYTDQLMSVAHKNTAGVHTLYLYSWKSSTTSASSITIAANTEYWISFSYIRNGLATLKAYTLSDGTLLGTVTLTCPNSSIAGFFIGAYHAFTAEASGVGFDIGHVVHEGEKSSPFEPLKPWEGTT